VEDGIHRRAIVTGHSAIEGDVTRADGVISYSDLSGKKLVPKAPRP
jgi:hypothetical protein